MGFMTSDAIRVEALCKRFDGVVAVDTISFAVRRGGTTALLGGNGAGKTTTLSMLMGVLLPTSGSIEVLGENMLTHRHRALPRLNFSSLRCLSKPDSWRRCGPPPPTYGSPCSYSRWAAM